MDRWPLLAELSLTQFGLVAVWQAAELGFGRDAPARFAAAQGWRRVGHGVYLLPGCELTPRARLKAVELALRRSVAFSHTSAGFLWGLLPSLVRPAHVSSGLGRTLRAQGAVVHRLSAFDRMELSTRSTMSVLAAPETLCTVAAVMPVGDLVRLLGKADRTRLATPKDVRAAADRIGSFKGRVPLLKALAQVDRDGLSHSELERLARTLLRRAGLEAHGRPFTVLDRHGRMVAEIDIAFIDAKVAVAIDGPHHGEAGQRRLDEDQRQQLEALGWIVVRADGFRLTNEPQRFVAHVQAALARTAH